MTANNSTTKYIVFFFVLDLKIVYYKNYYSLIIMSWTREENNMRHCLFGDKIIQNCLKISATLSYDNDL